MTGGSYVYIHRRADDGQAFYVGKGTGRRAWSRRRTLYWQNVVAKHGLKVEIIFSGAEPDCFTVEIATITRLRAEGAPLVNLTDGGEGASNPAPEVRARKSASTKVSWADPSVRKNRSAALKAAFSTPEARARMSELVRAAASRPEARGRRAAATRANWQRPEYRQAIAASTSARFSDPEMRAAHGAATSAALADPAVRAKMSAGIRAAYQRPEVKAKAAARQRARNTTATPMVGIDRRGKSYRARITSESAKIVIGSFSTLEEAQQARRQAEQQYWGVRP